MLLSGAGEDGHHARDPAAAGDAEQVLAGARIEGGRAERAEQVHPRSRHRVAEEPLAHPTVRLLLDDEDETLGLRCEVDHRIGARARDAGSPHQHELPGLEVERARTRRSSSARTSCVSMVTPWMKAARCLGRQASGAMLFTILPTSSVQSARGTHWHIRISPLSGRKRASPGRLGPLVSDIACYEPGLAGPARARPALVGQRDPAAQARVEDLLARLAAEGVGLVPGADGDLHDARIDPLRRDRRHCPRRPGRSSTRSAPTAARAWSASRPAAGTGSPRPGTPAPRGSARENREDDP